MSTTMSDPVAPPKKQDWVQTPERVKPPRYRDPPSSRRGTGKLSPPRFLFARVAFWVPRSWQPIWQPRRWTPAAKDGWNGQRAVGKRLILLLSGHRQTVASTIR